MAPNIINIYKNDSMEFINYGSLSDDLTVDDILSGVSMPQNPYLRAVIERFNNIGFLDSGLKSISSFYQEKKLDFKLKVLSSSFIVSIPRIPLEDDTIDITNESNVYYDKQIMKVLNYLKKYQEITRKEAEQIIDRTKITTLRILNEMVTKGLIVPINKGPAQKYILKE